MPQSYVIARKRRVGERNADTPAWHTNASVDVGEVVLLAEHVLLGIRL
jgi:hypothetical protein